MDITITLYPLKATYNDMQVSIEQTPEQMRQISAEIQQKYSICHFPDSLIVAGCKLLSCTLFSFDRNMLQSAKFEGILAFNPLRVRRF